jgi:peptide/nickel transport system substrate-binding protein
MTARTPLIVAIAMAVLLAACGPAAQVAEPQPEPPEPEGTAADDEASDDRVADGGTLVVAITSDPGHLNPAITTSGATHTAAELLYNGLVELDDDLNPVAELAVSWDIEENGALYRFHLRDDVVWHDGEPFTAADVKFSFEEVLLQFHSRTRASMSGALESIETPDEHTVEFRFAQPYAPLLLQLDVTEAPIVAQHVYAGTDPQEAEANLAPVGTGPFRFVSYTPDAEIRLERNPDYFKAGLPLLDEVVMRVIPEAGSQVIALEAGEVQWLWGTPGPDRERLLADPAFEGLQTPRNPGGANCIMTVSFNLEHEALSDLRVRQAIAHALDREAFLERVIFGEGRMATAPISSGIGWAHAEGLDLPDHDPDRARALLEEAGFGQDNPLAIDFVHFPTFSRYAELLRAQLAEVGVEVDLRPLEPPVFAPTVFADRDFDTNVISYCNGTDPEIGVRRMFDSAQIGPVPFSNAAAYSNPDVDALFDQAQQTVDLRARGEVYRQIQELVVADLPYFGLVETESTRVYSATCTGFRPYGLFAEEATCA